MSIRLLIVDDQELIRRGMESLVAGTEIIVAAGASSGSEALAQADRHPLDVVLLDVRMPDEDGLATLERLKQRHPDLPVLMFSAYEHPTYVGRAVALGASGYLSKAVGRQELMEAIHKAVRGETLWRREDMRRVSGALATPRISAELEVPLTMREKEVLLVLTSGQTNEQIAVTLGISYETVKEHVQHILRKIGVETRTQAAVWAVRKGLV